MMLPELDVVVTIARITRIESDALVVAKLVPVDTFARVQAPEPNAFVATLPITMISPVAKAALKPTPALNPFEAFV